jgi:hypothetical protein
MFGRLKELLRSGFTKLLKPVATKAATKLVQSEGDRLQREVKQALIQQGPDAIDRLFDAWQMRLISGLNFIKFMPAWLREGAIKVVQEEGDKLQRRAKDAAISGGPEALDLAFDTAQRVIIERINGL